jgi:radical SAM-linked protein
MPAQQRLRVTFGKGKPIRYISHLDLCLAWERALRRAGAPVTYSQAFNPQPKLQLAAALPVGYISRAELMDVFLDRPLAVEGFTAGVSAVLPAGLVVIAVQPVELQAPSLQSTLRQAEYRVTVETSVPAEELAGRIATLLAAGRFEQERVRKRQAERVDLRPLVDDVRLEAAGAGQVELWMRVSAGARGNLRPENVLAGLGLAGAYAQIQRTRLVFDA